MPFRYFHKLSIAFIGICKWELEDKICPSFVCVCIDPSTSSEMLSKLGVSGLIYTH